MTATQFRGRAPKFARVPGLGVCRSKEWITKIPGYFEGEDNTVSMWVLLVISEVTYTEWTDEQDPRARIWRVELFEHASDIDWLHDNIKPLELMIDQSFKNQHPAWSEKGSDSMTLLYRAYQYVLYHYTPHELPDERN